MYRMVKKQNHDRRRILIRSSTQTSRRLSRYEVLASRRNLDNLNPENVDNLSILNQLSKLMPSRSKPYHTKTFFYAIEPIDSYPDPKNFSLNPSKFTSIEEEKWPIFREPLEKAMFAWNNPFLLPCPNCKWPKNFNAVRSERDFLICKNCETEKDGIIFRFSPGMRLSIFQIQKNIDLVIKTHEAICDQMFTDFFCTKFMSLYCVNCNLS